MDEKIRHILTHGPFQQWAFGTIINPDKFLLIPAMWNSQHGTEFFITNEMPINESINKMIEMWVQHLKQS